MKPRARRLSLGTLTALLLCACAAAPPPQLTSRRDRLRDVLREDEFVGPPVYLFESSIGARSFNDEAGWDPLENQLEVGIAFASPLLGERTPDRTAASDWFSWELGVRYAFDSSERTARDLEARIIEVDAGIMIEPPNPYARLRPYLAGGAALSYTDVREEPAGGEELRERDVVTSPYLRAGLRFHYEDTRYFGLDLRWTDGRGRPVDGVGATLDSMTVSLLFGARF